MTRTNRQARIVVPVAIAFALGGMKTNRVWSRRTAGRSAGTNRSTSAVVVDGLFFPRSAELGLRVEATFSPRVERKLVYAGVCAESFGRSSDHLRQLADLDISSERIRRATHRVGRVRVQQRERFIREFLKKSLPIQSFGTPANAKAPTLACVMADGGRYQMLDRKRPTDDSEHWKESRIATFLDLEHTAYETDPIPDLPDFLRSVSIAKRLAEIGRVPGKNGQATERRDKPKEKPWPRPKIVNKTMVASTMCWEEFGAAMASQAWYTGFSRAKAKVFVSDGSSAIEKVQRRFFSHYVSVLDLMHALSYALTAARASTDDDANAWHRYVEWAEAIWQGRVTSVIASLRNLQKVMGDPPKDAANDDPREVVRRSFVYYSNHQSRMDYPKYRRQGFPITSAVMESSVKQINQRVKGSDKFWSSGGAEAILTLRADYLSDPSFETYWKSAHQEADGFRAYGTAG